MPFSPRFLIPATPRPAARRWMLALAMAAATASSSPAWSAPPSDTADPVTKFLAEKGLLANFSSPPGPASAKEAADAGTPGLVQQVRDRASDMVLTAMNFLGVPYKRGGTSEDTGFDCSGFTRHIFEMSVGLILPRRADEQAKSSSLVSIGREELKPGDLVFFNTLKRTFSHVGIYVGEGKFIHAPRSGSEVRVEDMRQAYWTQRFTGARRAPQVAGGDAGRPAAPAAGVPPQTMPTAAPVGAPAMSSLGLHPGAASPAAHTVDSNH